ncbi:MAG TPA: pseudouridine synthase [Candidatus Sulfotelmatobacter sp.]|nr:pseudouridine synthase [Candidatus Sulfotelmatobacter sp.]
MPLPPTSRKVGLARALSKLGYCSRSQGAKLIRAGRVRLNTKLCRDPETPVHLECDKIEVDGQALAGEQKVYLIMNKPRGIVTTASDEKGRETVYSVLDGCGESLPWISPVGRLDKASEGLLLLTNDSEWGSRVAAPETHLEKTYHVQIARLADEDFIRQIEKGVRTNGEEFLNVSRCRLLRSGGKNCWLEITLHEGKNRQIRRILETLGVEILRLVRVAIGPLQLGTLAKGTCRRLTPDEKRNLDDAMIYRKQRKSPPQRHAT